MARFMVKASEYKNICKAVNDSKLAELKKEIIEILKKQDEKEFKKAIDYLNSQELYYTHLEKSFNGKWIEKAGYGIGTVRTWKGKKYKKVAQGKWVRVFDKEGHGTNVAIGKLISKIQKCDNVEDLMALVMANKSRFVDENGVDLPILDKLRAAADIRNEKLSGESSSYTYGVGENTSRAKNEIFAGKDKITKEEAELHKVARKFSQMPTGELNKRKAQLERWIDNKTKSKRDHLNNTIWREKYQEELDAINDVLDKRGVKKTEKNKDNWIQDSKGNRLTVEEAKKRIKDQANQIKVFEDLISERSKADGMRMEAAKRSLEEYNRDLMSKLNPEDRKEMETEYEKHQNRSDAMKGNQNAKKYGLTDDQIEYYDIQEVVEDVNGYGIVKNSEGKYSYIDDGRVKDRPEDFDTSIEKVKERINDSYETKKNIEAANNYNFKDADFGKDVIYKKLSNGKHEYYKKTPEGKAIFVKIEISDMREPLNMTYEVTDVKTGEIWQYETAYGNEEGFEWAVERPEQMEKELKKFFKRDPNKEWDKMNSDTTPNADVYTPSESTNIETKKAIAENKKVGENEVQMPYSKELGVEMKTLKNCVSKDPNREFMNHVYYDNGNLIATDGKRLKTVKVGELDGIENGSYVDVDVSKDGIDIKKMEGMDDKRFPNYARVIPDDLSQKITLKNDVIKEKIKELKKDGAIDKKINKVQLEIKDGKLYLDDTEIGDAQGVNLKYSNDWGNTKNDTNFININADYLVNALNGDSSILMLGERADKAVGISTDSTTNIIMPMGGSDERMNYSENKVRKSLSDGLLGLGFIEDDELEDEIDEQKEVDEENFTGTDYNDYSAEQPELFNSTEFKVREALNRRFNCL